MKHLEQIEREYGLQFQPALGLKRWLMAVGLIVVVVALCALVMAAAVAGILTIRGAL